MPLKHSPCSLLEGQSHGDVFRYDDVRTPGMLGTVDFAHTGGFPGVLNTLRVITGNHPVCPCARGIESSRSYGIGKALLTILGLTEGQKSSLRLCDVMQAVREAAANEQETLATIVHLLSSGQVRLSAPAMQAIRELLVTTTAAA
jgi:hypothetical protein